MRGRATETSCGRPATAVAGPLVAFALLVASAWGCPGEEQRPPAEPSGRESSVAPSEAVDFAEALRADDPEEVLRWFRADHPVEVRTKCTSCSPERRWRRETLRSRRAVRTFAEGLGHPETAQPGRGGPMPLAFETPACSESCCEFPRGLLDHATIYLARVCFDRDEQGRHVRRIVLIDGS